MHKKARSEAMTSEQCDILKDIFRNVVAMGKGQQLELSCYVRAFQAFEKVNPQYAKELEKSLEMARKTTVLEDRSLAQFELATEKFLSTPLESLPASELSEILEIIKQKFST
jgi:hypothetical protein